MKHPHSPRGGRFTGFLLALASICLQASADDSVPRGTLDVDRDLVRVGSRSQLNWKIEYPANIQDIVEIETPGTIIPKKKLTMRVRTLGVAFQSGSKLLPLQGFWSKNNGSWQRFFYGTGPQVIPTQVLVETEIAKNDRIDFGGRAWSGRDWYPFHHTRKTDKYVIVLKNGDNAPSYAPAYDQAGVESFLSPYIDGRGRIRIGNRDLIILWEGSTAKPGSTYFDMQDLVVLVTFE